MSTLSINLFFRRAVFALAFSTLTVSASHAQTGATPRASQPLQSATAPPLRPAPTTAQPASPEEMRQRPSLENGLSGAVPLTNDTALGRPDESPNGSNIVPNGAPRTGGAMMPRTQDETAAVNDGNTSEGTRASGLQNGESGRPVPEGGSLGGLSPFVALLGAALVGAFLFATLWIRRSKTRR